MSILRKLYYSINPEMRLWVRKLYYLPHTIFSQMANRNELAPPKSLIYTGSGDFLKKGIEWKEFFIEHGLRAEHSFLDIGSGIGRIALGLTKYLKGEYKGFEAMEVGAKWCQKNISPKYPNFDFKYIQLHNDLYNSEGIDASKYEFDYPVRFFDFACAISVFTHMIDTEVDNYLKEAAKVMKPNGRFVATFFISGKDNENQSQAAFRFDHEFQNYFLMDKKVKGANVCFKRNYLLKIIDNAGFDVIKEFKGTWSGSPQVSPVAFQDVLVLQRRLKMLERQS